MFRTRLKRYGEEEQHDRVVATRQITKGSSNPMLAKLERSGARWRLTTYRIGESGGLEPIATSTGPLELLAATAGHRSALLGPLPNGRRRSRSGTFAFCKAELIQPEFKPGIGRKIVSGLDSRDSVLGVPPHASVEDRLATGGVRRVGLERDLGHAVGRKGQSSEDGVKSVKPIPLRTELAGFRS